MADPRLEPFMTPALAAAFTAALLVILAPFSLVPTTVIAWTCGVDWEGNPPTFAAGSARAWACSHVETPLTVATFPGASLVLIAAGCMAGARRRARPLLLGVPLAVLVAVAPAVLLESLSPG